MMDRKYHREYSQKYYHKRKKILTKMLGGKCVKCNSKKKLQFDHIDPSTKSFKLGKLLNHKWSDILEEIKKCQILCFDCHINKSREEGSFIKNRRERVRLVEETVLKTAGV